MTKLFKMSAGVAAAALIATSAHAGITGDNPMGVLRALQNFGYVATLGTDDAGDPKISSRVSETKFSVYFYGCENGEDCTSVMFRAGYNLNDGISALKINEWNSEKRFVRGYIDDEGDPFLEMDVNLDFDGVGTENFDDSLDLWRLQVEGFEDFIDW